MVVHESWPEQIVELRPPFDELDRGIVEYVRVLFAEGVETYESCEGGSGHAFPEPTIRFSGGMHAGMKALGLMIERGLPVRALRRTWRVIDGEPSGPTWELVFWKKVGD